MSEPAALFDLKDRVACVTGASAGLGQRAATVLAQAGAQVVGIARRREALDEWASVVGPKAAPVAADLSDRDIIPALVEAISEPFGPPDIIVHAAGINTRETVDEVTQEGWDITLDLNLRIPFFLSQALVPAMKSKAGAVS